MSTITNLREAFVLKLKVLYDIEQELVKALPKMVEAATNLDLKEAFREHLNETRTHVVRLEQSLQSLGEELEGNESAGIRGIIADAEWLIKQKLPSPLLDLMLAGAARYAEHYEMAGYMVAINLADLLEENETRERLNETLSEEESADDKLEMLGETELTAPALATDEDDNDDGHSLMDKIDEMLGETDEDKSI